MARSAGNGVLTELKPIISTSSVVIFGLNFNYLNDFKSTQPHAGLKRQDHYY
ncbi:hypothetical protein [Piscirickettsia salmonis]|uniref:hypothetical protein n=1 Tax=Piscirickettsia salmonis TaxID=1238 RepID=UPI0003031893|nr:hypothetical protein [Piscirickettsia salmonis]ERL62200.1 hypothetical protein K661_01438 [Piscirickettsia salmonis LF-89 = ATCC VR-1361]QHS31561.1 hypothetical protein GW535_02495 [Piscirickettsia salmonis]QIX56522.1 hypothetical protein GW536_15095 [Piscirickettsia salmonis]QNR80175.1 hypothetical protein ICC15_14830 [Piscirickettsia salmonis]